MHVHILYYIIIHLNIKKTVIVKKKPLGFYLVTSSFVRFLY